MAREKVTRNPSPYPRVLFHGIRLVQFIASAIVTGILAFFVHYLIEDSYYIPWTFLVLLAVSAFTNVSVFVTAFFYHYRTLRPKLSSVINTFLTALWIMGFGMLTYQISPLLKHQCNVKNWDGWEGIMVCRMYKAVETFTVIGMVATASSLLLDIFTLRKAHSRGKYNQMGGLDAKRGRNLSPFHRNDDDFSDRLVPEDTTAYGVPHATHSRSPSADARDMRRQYRAQQPIEAGRFGYAQPVEQTTYEGAGGRALDAHFAREGA